MIKSTLIFIDCEAWGGCPATGGLTEFGAVEYASRKTFHGVLVRTTPDPKNPAIPIPVEKCSPERLHKVFDDFDTWLRQFPGKWTAVSDNPAFDWQWINDGFWRALGRNPLGFSARRISDFYAGLRGDWSASQQWKRLRRTPHDHNPVNDAMGNVEAFERMLSGER